MIYIVVCGVYENADNALVTDNINQAIKFAISRRYYRGIPKELEPQWYNQLSHIEVWKDGNRICEYNPDYGVAIKDFRQYLTPEEFKLGLIKAIKKAEEENEYSLY